MDSTEKFDIMRYGPGTGDGRSGLMTKTEARAFASTLEHASHVIGWVPGTCQSVFQFWLPETGLAIEIPHAAKFPEGRKAAIMVQKAKGLRVLTEE